MSEDKFWNDWFLEIKGDSSLDLLLLAAAKRRRRRKVRLGVLGVFAMACIGLIGWKIWPREPNPEAPPIANGNTPSLPHRQIPPVPDDSGDEGPSRSTPGPTPDSKPVRPNSNPNGLAVKPGAPDEESKAQVSLSILSDDELFDLLKGQSVAIVGEKGHRRVIFLEPVSTRNRPTKSKGNEPG